MDQKIGFYSPYRWCIARNCKNSTLKTPAKLFILVPLKVSIRNVWLELAGRDPQRLSPKSSLFLCEDHFNLEQDMENYMQFKIMGSVKRIQMKPNILPSKFSHAPLENPSPAAESPAAHSSSTSFHIKVEVDSEPWDALQEVDSLPLGAEEVKHEIDIEEHDLLQHPRVRAMLASRAHRTLIADNDESPTTPQLTPTKVEASSIKLEDESMLARVSSAPLNGEPFRCNRCEYTSTQRYPFKIHLRKHTGEKPFKCDQCEYRCRERCSLNKHLKIHTEEKPFKCNQCEYRCREKSILKKHLRTHTGEKPFKCGQCEYRCNESGTLITHARIHTGEKPFKCNQCEYTCSQKTNLNHHLKIHTGEKPFKCDLCDYKSVQKINLEYHLRIHTGERPFKCDQCEYRSILKSTMKRHRERHIRE